MENKGIKIIFMGTPEFAVPPLEALAAGGYNVIAAITNPDKPVGRKKILTPPPVKIAAQNRGVAVFQPKSVKDAATIEEIKNLAPDLIVICAYGKIIPKEILEIPRFGVINVHASLLPRWRGPSPIQYAILNGDKETGITIMAVNEKMDEGGVYSQETIEIEKTDDAESLGKKLSETGADLLIKTLPEIISGELKSRPQEEFAGIWGTPSYCKILKKEDGKIDWNKSADKIERQIRAFIKEPGSFFVWNRGGTPLEIKILATTAIEYPANFAHKIGEVFLIEKGRVGVKTAALAEQAAARAGQAGDGCLEILKLQPSGKSPMEMKNFLNGYPDFIGTTLN